jgi:hypothetical protein
MADTTSKQINVAVRIVSNVDKLMSGFDALLADLQLINESTLTFDDANLLTASATKHVVGADLTAALASILAVRNFITNTGSHKANLQKVRP